MSATVARRLLDSWHFAEAGSEDWREACIPGHVHCDLMRHGLIEDPFLLDKEKDCQWVDEHDWSYRCTFQWRPDEARPHRVLQFDGLDTVCSIYLNGEKIGEHDNMFVPLEIDVSGLLRDGANQLGVDFQSAARVGLERKAKYLAEQGLAEDVPNFDERAFVRKAQYMFGWDWGPRLVSCGIWKPVTLIESDRRLDPVTADGKILEDTRGRVQIDSYPAAVANCVWHEISQPDGQPENEFHDDAGFFVANPSVWSLHDPKLYSLRTAAMSGYEDDAYPVDENYLKFGICNLKLLQEPDKEGSSFEFVLNSERIYALGANWIPDHSFPSQVSRERYRERLQQAKDLGVNMLRIWGGGIYEDDAFYKLCDELGILVWQDFMFACSYYPEDESSLENIKAEAEFQIRRLRHHPCIAIWCGNNECHQVWQDGWGGKDKQPSRFHGEKIYHEVLREAVKRLDPGRPYWPGSPFGSGYCNSGKDGDQHYWDVWHGRGDWTYYKESDARFCSEFGFMSSPSAATWKRAGIETSIDKEDPIARAHNKTGKPFDVIEGLIELHYPRARTLDEWSYFSQLNQRDAMRAAIEHFRFSERCRGALLWQLNDCWPVESWSVLEFNGHKKATAYELPRLFAPLLLTADIEGDLLVLRACLHNYDDPIEGQFSLRTWEQLATDTESLASRRGTQFDADRHLDVRVLAAATSGPAIIQPNEGKEIARIPVGANDNRLIWHAQFAGAHAYGHNLRPVDTKHPKIEVNIDGCEATLSSDEPFIDVFLEDANDHENSFEPNFFCLLPGSRLTVQASRPIGRLVARCLDLQF